MNDVSSNYDKWLQQGYELFGEIGPLALNAEKLSSLVGLNRSSFYHYFGTMEAFEKDLLEFHIERYKIVGDIIKDYEALEELFSEDVFQHQDALLFQRQLLIHQGTERYRKCSEGARAFTEAKTFELWSTFTANDTKSEEEWNLFKAVRDFYFIHHGQQPGLGDPKEVIVMLHQFLKGDRK